MLGGVETTPLEAGKRCKPQCPQAEQCVGSGPPIRNGAWLEVHCKSNEAPAAGCQPVGCSMWPDLRLLRPKPRFMYEIVQLLKVGK